MARFTLLTAVAPSIAASFTIAIALSACSTDPATGFIVGLSTQLSLREMSVRIENGHGVLAKCLRYDLREGAATPVPISLPATLGIEPENAEALTHGVRVQVLAFAKEPTSDPCEAPRPPEAIVRAEAVVSYVRGSVLDLPLPITLSCVGVLCPDDAACRFGKCQPVAVDARELATATDGVAPSSSCYPLESCGTATELSPSGACTFVVPSGLDLNRIVPFVRYDLGNDADVSEGAEFLDSSDYSIDRDARSFTLSDGLCKLLAAGTVSTVGIAHPCDAIRGKAVCRTSRAAATGLLDAAAGQVDATAVDGKAKEADARVDATFDGATPSDASDGSDTSDGTTPEGASDAARDTGTDAGTDANFQGGSAGDCSQGTCCGYCLLGLCFGNLATFSGTVDISQNVGMTDTQTMWIEQDSSRAATQFVTATRGGNRSNRVSLTHPADAMRTATGFGSAVLTTDPILKTSSLHLVDNGADTLLADLDFFVAPFVAVSADAAFVVEKASAATTAEWQVVRVERAAPHMVTFFSLTQWLSDRTRPLAVEVQNDRVVIVFEKTPTGDTSVVSVPTATGIGTYQAYLDGLGGVRNHVQAVTLTSDILFEVEVVGGQTTLFQRPLSDFGGTLEKPFGGMRGATIGLPTVTRVGGTPDSELLFLGNYDRRLIERVFVSMPTGHTSDFAPTEAEPKFLRSNGACAAWIDSPTPGQFTVKTVRLDAEIRP